MLEEIEEAVAVGNNSICMQFRPFEIKTIRLERE